MKLDRRTFLIGTAAMLASPVIAKPSKFMGEFSTGLLKGETDRKICDLMFSCMPTGEELKSSNWREDPTIFTFSRGNETVLRIQLNPRATFRWVPVMDAEIVLPKNEFLKFEVTPCYTSCVLNIISNTELRPPHVAPSKMVSDSFEWRDGKLIDQTSSKMYLEDKLVR